MNILYIAAGLLLIAVFPLPYGYYTFCRIAISAITIYVALNHLKKETISFYIFIGIAILFNPIVPIHLSKEIWIPIDLILSIYFIYIQRNLKK